MSVVQYSQQNYIDSQGSLSDNLLKDSDDSLSELQKKNIGVGLYGMSPISGTTGMLNTNGGFDRINQSIKIILHTLKGEIPMLPKLGSNLEKLLFDQIDDVLDDDIQLAISDALNEFEPRIKVLNINISHDNRDLNRVDISVEYVLTNTNIVHQFEDTIYTSNGGVV